GGTVDRPDERPADGRIFALTVIEREVAHLVERTGGESDRVAARLPPPSPLDRRLLADRLRLARLAVPRLRAVDVPGVLPGRRRTVTAILHVRGERDDLARRGPALDRARLRGRERLTSLPVDEDRHSFQPFDVVFR